MKLSPIYVSKENTKDQNQIDTSRGSMEQSVNPYFSL